MNVRLRHPPRRGAAAVELAVVLPLLVFLLVAAIDYGRVFYHALTLQNCARNGALFGSYDPSFAANSAGIKKAALADASNLSPAPTIVSTTGVDTDGHSYVEVTCSWKFATVVPYPGIPKTTQLTQSVRMRVAPDRPLDAS